MTSFLRKSKAAILDLLKSLPAMHMAEEKDLRYGVASSSRPW
jgi:hypothetical protein